ncbi:MAG: hypothetical protein QNJ46_08535, partial [Leptolyngbyaceae cyanobacterium MO_188.B28]|nr:hypothetical protein [Leptolyngbyaceae cyanobacterium MO_188.B28]
MTEYLTISKTKPEFPDYLDFGKLRDVGIGHLQALSGEIWTDYNLHDPGITILEVLCYAITDLGYRSNFEIKDLLALKPDDTDENNFFTPDQILTCNPVTELDWRKRLIDIDGVRNAWLEKLHNYVPPISIDWDNSRLRYTSPDEAEKPDEVQTSADELQPTSSGKSFNPRGLYRVHLDLDPAYRKDACGHFYQEKARVLKAVNQVLLSYRNLCEDFHEVLVLEDEEIALCSDIELNADADPEDVLVNIYLRIQEFLLPRIQFYTLQELLAKGRTPAEIFAGRPSALSQHDPHFELPGDPAPVLYSNGFIDVEDLAALTPPKEIHTSDLYREILQAPGVAAVRKLSIANVINGLLQSQGKAWSLPLTPDHRPLLTIDHSRVTLYKGDLPLPVDRAEVKRRYFEQQVAAIKTRRDAYDLDLRAPQGQYFDNLADHYSIQHDFPLTYGISEDGLPDTMPALRKAQAKQLKGYLVFFDQLLANYLAQLAHVRDLFSWKSDPKDKNHEGSSQDQKRTYFTQALDFPAWSDILVNDTTDESYLKAIEEDNVSYQARRNRFLNHLLARFAESFTDYALLNYQVHRSALSKSDVDKELIADKTRFLKDYPRLSRDRNRAFNYSDPVVWDTPNISGFKHRVSRLLGINDIDDVDHDVKRRSLSPAPLQSEPEDLIWSLSWVETNDNNRILTLKSQQTYSEKTEAQR